MYSYDPPSITDRLFSKTILSRSRRRLAVYACKIGVKKSFRRIAMTKRNADDFKKSFGENFKVIYPGGYYKKSFKSNKWNS